jgi:hypothetical protein
MKENLDILAGDIYSFLQLNLKIHCKKMFPPDTRDDPRTFAIDWFLEIFDEGPVNGYYCQKTSLQIIQSKTITAQQITECIEGTQERKIPLCICLKNLLK